MYNVLKSRLRKRGTPKAREKVCCSWALCSLSLAQKYLLAVIPSYAKNQIESPLACTKKRLTSYIFQDIVDIHIKKE
jgi:hypothetical protein